MGKYLGMLLLIYFGCTTASFADNYYAEHEKGWYWFDDPVQKSEKKDAGKKTSENAVKENDPIERVDQVRKTLKESLDQAIMDPTPDNVERYMALQNQMSQRANQFTNVWQKVLLNHPELNYSIAHPTSNVALQVYHENESKEKEAVLKKFAEHSGLFFFYKSTCHYCQRFAPILKHFAEEHHIAVIPITMDGVSLPEFPDSKQDTGQSKLFHVTLEPSLYAVDPATQKAYPVAYGLASETELISNIYNIMTKYQEGM